MPRRIIVVSNAGPAKFKGSETELSAGGVVTALKGLGSALNTWIQVPSTSTEFGMASRGGTASVDGIKVAFGNLSPAQQEALYSKVSNGAIVHYVLGQSRNAQHVGDGDWRLFREGSQAMAQAALEQVLASSRGTKFGLFIDDYQMVLVPGLMRRLLVENGREGDVHLQMHIHTTWSYPEDWNGLSANYRAEIVRGMLGADAIGFHTATDVRNFANCVGRWLSGASVSGNSVRFEGRTIKLVANPLGIDTRGMTSKLNSSGGRDAVRKIARLIDGRTNVVASIGRTDPTKKLDTLLLAYERDLQDNPEKVSDTVLLLHLTKSRLNVPVYARHFDLLNREVDRINGRFWEQAGGRNVVEKYVESDPFLPLGQYAQYTVLVIPSERDGLALTALEGPWVNQKDGVLILSTGAGAYTLLSDGALRFVPGSGEVEQLAGLLQQASEMSPRERARRQQSLRANIRRYDMGAWLKQRLSLM
ncbi:trehalose-6-phosphate synthase [Ktedonospora formicarum]|uniref:Trehalose-6-phosphate synthase n=1 Tax=Ktedonospora formicarum TaxID=2778364 RepID=A0A8J3I2C7_9CHLR|nr:trehalose-6-phosphate synthase [Ktedonospora formicarum]GHO48044.1 trehalose-6-phosphate synthase [Ktedonospora formicarum]